jgi:hypothetical protein
VTILHIFFVTISVKGSYIFRDYISNKILVYLKNDLFRLDFGPASSIAAALIVPLMRSWRISADGKVVFDAYYKFKIC